MVDNLADFVAVAARPFLALWLSLIPWMILEWLEDRGKGKD